MRQAIPRTVLLLLLASWAGAGCSTSEDKLLGASRLLRGPGGVGTTERITLSPDRDTYVGTDKAFFTPTLLVGVQASLQARSFFSTSTWSVPAVPQDSVTEIVVVLPVVEESDRPQTMLVGLSYGLTPYDSSLAWPGPLPDSPFAVADVGDPGPLKFQIPTSSFADLQGWAAAPATFPGFVAVSVGADTLVALDAATAAVWVISKRIGGAGVLDTTKTALTRHFSLRTALAPAPTGTDAALILGGNYNTGCLFHFPSFSVPEGSTVNEATLRLRVDPATVPFASGDKVDITAQRVKTPWTEGDVTRDALTVDETAIGTRTGVVVSAGDSVITVALPASIIREWGSAGGVNEGVLLLLKQPYYAPPIRLRSRETSLPCELQVSFTSPPPPRF